MRFLHAADLHLDSPLRAQALRNRDLAEALRDASRQGLTEIVDQAYALQVDAVLLAGDVFDSAVADLTTRAALAAACGRLSRARIPVVMIRGNHDALLDLARFGPLADNVFVLEEGRPTVTIGQTAFHGLSFSDKHIHQSLLPRYPVPDPGKINVGLMHTSLDGAAGHDPYAPCATSDLLAHGYDYWALGHIHARFERRSDSAVAVMPGIPQGRSIREPGRGSVTLVDCDGTGVQVSAVPIAKLAFVQGDVDLGSCTTQAEMIAALAQALGAAAVDDALSAVRLWISGAPDLAGQPQFARSLAEEAADGLADVFVDAVRFAETPAPAEGMAGDLAQRMRASAQAPGFQDAGRAHLAELRAALPAEIADVLGPERHDTLLDDGIAQVALRLRGGVTES